MGVITHAKHGGTPGNKGKGKGKAPKPKIKDAESASLTSEPPVQTFTESTANATSAKVEGGGGRGKLKGKLSKDAESASFDKGGKAPKGKDDTMSSLLGEPVFRKRTKCPLSMREESYHRLKTTKWRL